MSKVKVSSNKSQGDVHVNSMKSLSIKTNTKTTENGEIVYIRCGCMGSRHKYISSCSNCGRIVCESEHPPPYPCVVCGVEVLNPMTAEQAFEAGFDEALVKSYKQKDKLLVFDREHAARTHVYDDQADYYETSTWLTEEEKISIDLREKKRRDKYKRINKKTTLSLDVSAMNFVEDFDDDYDNETISCDNIDKEENKIVIIGSTISNNGLSEEISKAGNIYRELKSKIDRNNKINKDLIIENGNKITYSSKLNNKIKEKKEELINNSGDINCDNDNSRIIDNSSSNSSKLKANAPVFVYNGGELCDIAKTKEIDFDNKDSLNKILINKNKAKQRVQHSYSDDDADDNSIRYNNKTNKIDENIILNTNIKKKNSYNNNKNNLNKEKNGNKKKYDIKIEI
jgi:hypothetical protein